MKSITIKVTEQTELLEFLYEKLHPMPKKKIKSFLTHRSIVVNGRVVTQFNYVLVPGQSVLVDTTGRYDFLHQNKIELLHEDDEIIVINKPCGTLSVAADDPDEKNAYDLLTQYVRLADKAARIFVVHRLDRDTSGVLMFSKNEQLKDRLQEKWNDLMKERLYYAIVQGPLKQKQGNVTNYLKQDKNTRVYATSDPRGDKSVTDYKVINEKNGFSLLDVAITTGKKNQIRVAMKELGNPIIGDKKYGSKTNPIKRMGLHAYKLTFLHPVTGNEMSFMTKLPNSFRRLMEGTYEDRSTGRIHSKPGRP